MRQEKIDGRHRRHPEQDARNRRSRSAARCRAGRSRSLSVAGMLVLWEIFGRHVNPVFGSYPSAIAVAFWELLRSGQLGSALSESLQPFFVGYGLAIVIGIPVGLVVGRFRTAEAAFGIYITAGYAMPLVALVPLLDPVAGARLQGQGRGGVPDVAVPDLHQHLARRHRGAEDADRGRQVVRGARISSSCAASSCRRRCLTSWPASAWRSAARWWRW